jgi:hypothetical protein
VITADDVVWETGPELLNPGRAALSPNRVYRYQLTRTWNPQWPPVTWIMLNPSTADAFTDDATIKKITRTFTRPWGAGGITVVNLFAYRATEPARLRAAADPVGARNDAFIRDACCQATVVVAAWGAHGQLHDRAAAVTRMLTGAGVRPLCLGTTKDGHPLHPLYVKGDTPLRPYGGPR